MRRLIALIGGVGLGLTASQFSEFAQQYTQRLGGAVDELAIITERFDAAATGAGLTRPEAFIRYRSASDEFIAGQGQDMEATFVRFERLKDQLTSIENVSAIERMISFGTYFDNEIASRALDAYEPAVPVTAEGMVYAVGGTFLGFGAISMLIAGFTRVFRRRGHSRHAAGR